MLARSWPERYVAVRCTRLCRAAASRQLLAVCCLLAGDFAAAVRWAGEVPCESHFKRLAAQ